MRIKTRYKTFGMLLGLSFVELKAIQKTNMFDMEDALMQVVITWLQQKYNTTKFGLPTWRRIVEAIDSEAGGNNHALAKQIASHHPGSHLLSHGTQKLLIIHSTVVWLLSLIFFICLPIVYTDLHYFMFYFRITSYTRILYHN